MPKAREQKQKKEPKTTTNATDCTQAAALPRLSVLRLRLRLRVSTTARPPATAFKNSNWKSGSERSNRRTDNDNDECLCVCECDMRTLSRVLSSCLSLSKCFASRTAEQSKQSKQALALESFRWLGVFLSPSFSKFLSIGQEHLTSADTKRNTTNRKCTYVLCECI